MTERQCPDGCGACCDPVVMPYGPMDLLNHRLIAVARQMDSDELENLLFAREHLTPMKRREGLRRAPYLTQGGVTAFQEYPGGPPQLAYSYFYSCDRFDPKTRRCTAYDDRPPMCRDYPDYGMESGDPWYAAKALPHTCIYRADIGQPVEPVAVRITAKP